MPLVETNKQSNNQTIKQSNNQIIKQSNNQTIKQFCVKAEAYSTRVLFAVLGRCILVWSWLGLKKYSDQKNKNELTIAK
jgi:hypothetical protein